MSNVKLITNAEDSKGKTVERVVFDAGYLDTNHVGIFFTDGTGLVVCVCDNYDDTELAIVQNIKNMADITQRDLGIITEEERLARQETAKKSLAKGRVAMEMKEYHRLKEKYGHVD